MTMLETLFWIVVGIFIGWHIPEPLWVSELRKTLIEKIKNDYKLIVS